MAKACAIDNYQSTIGIECQARHKFNTHFKHYTFISFYYNFNQQSPGHKSDRC
jgi:hypothetical protein